MLKLPLVPLGRFNDSVAANKTVFVSGVVNETTVITSKVRCSGKAYVLSQTSMRVSGGSALLMLLAWCCHGAAKRMPGVTPLQGCGARS